MTPDKRSLARAVQELVISGELPVPGRQRSRPTNDLTVLPPPNGDTGPAVDECFTEARERMRSGKAPHQFTPGSDWKQYLQCTDSGSIKANVANAIAALTHAPAFAGRIAYDEFAVRVVSTGPLPWKKEPHPWTDTEDILLAQHLQLNGIQVSRDIAGQAVEAVSRQRPFHPVREYLDALSWDGAPRLNTWLETYLGADASEQGANYLSAVGARWFISGVARIYQPGCKADSALILEGPQGRGKSRTIKTLGGQWSTDEVADLGSKDSSLQIHGVWIIELAELDSMAKSDVSRVKAFMSRAKDRFRPPYGKRLVDLPRQCIFAGTVNHSSYLKDETGGRRSWPVSCGRIDIDAVERDRDQLWAEAVARFRAGEVWWLDQCSLIERAEAEQAARYEGDAWDSLIIEWVDARMAAGSDSVSVPEILETCIEKNKDQWTRADEMRVAKCLRANGWERYRDRKRGMEWRYRKVVPNV
jgi:putative DNA primase/helicase